MDQLFYDIFERLPRQGPGDNDSTRKAFDILTSGRELPEHLNILDIGCGTGIHTIQLAKLMEGKVIAMDNHQPFLDNLQNRLAPEGVSGKIDCVKGDMAAMTFEKESFDIIWSEGSIFIIGVEKGLTEWKKFLRPGGLIALTDVFWLKPDIPAELRADFEKDYPGMLSLEDALKVVEGCGYNRIDHFCIPRSAWWDDYYGPLKQQLKVFREKTKGKPEAAGIIDSLQFEIDLFKKYPGYYGYVFFMLEKKE